MQSPIYCWKNFFLKNTNEKKKSDLLLKKISKLKKILKKVNQKLLNDLLKKIKKVTK